MSAKVLLVDDEEGFVEVLALRLRARGIAASTATTAEEALRKVEEESFDVVVLDLMMPDLDGLKFLNVLKMKDPNLPVIVFTAEVAAERFREAGELGAFDVIPKPTDLRILTRTIEELMTRKKKKQTFKKSIDRQRVWQPREPLPQRTHNSAPMFPV